MSRLSFAVPVLFAAVAFGPLPQARQQALDMQPLTDNVIRHEPVLVLERSGATLLGPVQQLLVVYDDGRVSMSSMRPQPGLASPQAVQIENREIELAAVHELCSGLFNAGAFELTDQKTTALDVPLTTITFFRGEADAKAHTFSYWIPSDEFGAVEAVLDRFTATYFPAF